MGQTLTTDPIMTLAEAQEIFDFRSDQEGIYLINALSAKARAWLNRVNLLSTSVTEYIRTAATPTIWLHASPASAVTVEYYREETVQDTWTTVDSELVVFSNDYSARIDYISGWFPCALEDAYHKVSYTGGWSTVPGEVFMGAIQQGRVELKRFRGEVGMVSHSMSGESIQADRLGVIAEVAEVWRPYRILV